MRSPTTSPASGQVPSARTPEARLKRIEAVLADPGLSPAEVRAIVGIVTHGNDEGLAWPGQRLLRRRFHVGGCVIASALKKSRGVHLQEAGLGPRGVQKYRVLAVFSAPTVGALNDTPARPLVPPSAPARAIQCAQRRARNQQRKKTTEPKEESQDGDGFSSSPTARENETVDIGRQSPTTSGNGTVAVLAAKARMGGGKWPFEQWAGQVEEDVAAKRYTLADLETFVANRTSVTAAPWRLAEEVRRHAQTQARAAFDARPREIRANGLTRAEPVRGPNDARQPTGPDLRYIVRWADDGILVIEAEMRLRDRWVRMGADQKWELRSLAEAARWRFRPDQPWLFENEECGKRDDPNACRVAAASHEA